MSGAPIMQRVHRCAPAQAAALGSVRLPGAAGALVMRSKPQTTSSRVQTAERASVDKTKKPSKPTGPQVSFDGLLLFGDVVMLVGWLVPLRRQVHTDSAWRIRHATLLHSERVHAAQPAWPHCMTALNPAPLLVLARRRPPS